MAVSQAIMDALVNSSGSLQSAVALIGEATRSGIDAIPKEQKGIVKLILDEFTGAQKREITRLGKAGNLALATDKINAALNLEEAKITGRQDLVRAEGDVKSGLIADKAAATELTGEAATTQKIRLEEQKLALETTRAKAQVDAEALAQKNLLAPDVAQLKNTEGQIKGMIHAKGAIDQDQISRMIDTIQDELPGSARVKSNLHFDLEQRLALAKKGAGEAAVAAGLPEALVQEAESNALRTGVNILDESRPGSKAAVSILQEKANAFRVVENLAQNQGLRVSGLATEGPPKVSRISSLPGFGGAGVQQATSVLEEVATQIKGGNIKEGLAAAKKALPGIGKAPRNRAGLILAGLAALLASRSGGDADGQQQLPPAQQIQLTQQLAQLQQNQQLTDSLVGARGAQANQNNARADLLRLQALLTSGAGSGGGLI